MTAARQLMRRNDKKVSLKNLFLTLKKSFFAELLILDFAATKKFLIIYSGSVFRQRRRRQRRQQRRQRRRHRHRRRQQRQHRRRRQISSK